MRWRKLNYEDNTLRSLITNDGGFAIITIMAAMIAIFIALGVALNYSYPIESQEVNLTYSRMQSYWAMAGTLDYMLARCRQDFNATGTCAAVTDIAANNYQNEVQLFPSANVVIGSNTIKFQNPSNSLFLPLTVGISIDKDNSSHFCANVTSWTRQ